MNSEQKLERRRWSSKQRRAYFKILSGFSRHKGSEVRFITLTSPGDDEQVKSLGKAWNHIVTTIRRMTVRRLIREGYLKPGQVRRFYAGKGLDEPLEFEYCKVETCEGHGVLHVISVGDYLPVKWLRDLWIRYRGAWLVDIRACKKRVYHERNLARYCVSQYTVGQEAFVRCTCSGGWVFRGFVKAWKWLRNEVDRFNSLKWTDPRSTLDIAIRLWHAHLNPAFAMHPVTLGPLSC